jgi:lysozyme family protein
MVKSTLPLALDLVFGHEGGYSNVATDRGGPTKYGITHRTLAAYRRVDAVSAEQVKALTKAEAERIYRAHYWRDVAGDDLPVGLDYAVFDFGVNSGPRTAVKVLQRVLGMVEIDGVVGRKTIAAAQNYPKGLRQLIRDYCEARMDFLRGLTNRSTGFPANGRGWTIRVTGKDPKGEWKPRPGVVGEALAMVDAAERGAKTPVSLPPAFDGVNPETHGGFWAAVAAFFASLFGGRK